MKHFVLQRVCVLLCSFIIGISLSGKSSLIDLCYDDGSVESLSLTSEFADCITSPVIVCPPNYFGCLGDDTEPASTGWATATPGDVNCEQPVISYVDNIVSTGPCTGQVFLQRVWTAVYPNNSNPWLVSDCTQTILLKDDEAPQITNCPQDITVQVGSECEGIVNYTEPSASDNCELISFTGSHSSGDIFNIGATTVQYTATDVCGNTSQCSFSITIEGTCCSAPPTITCPADITLCSDARSTQCENCLVDEVTSGLMGISDDADQVFKYNPGTGTMSSISLANAPGPFYSIATNPNDEDEFYFAASGKLYIGDYATAAYSLIGNIGVPSAIVGLDLSENGNLYAVNSNEKVLQLNLSTGQGTILFSTSLSTTLDLTHSTQGYFWISGSNLVAKYDINGNQLGLYTIPGTAKGVTVDDCGIIYYCTSSSLLVFDMNTGQSSTLLNFSGITCNDLDSYHLANPISTDYIEVIDCSTGAFIEYIDESGNPYTPIGCSSTSVECDFGGGVGVHGYPTVTPGMGCADPIITYQDQIISEGPCEGQKEIKRIWTATDPNNATLTVSCNQFISLIDDEAPIFTSCPTDQVVASGDNCEAIVTWNDPIATDNCEVSSIDSTYDSGDSFPIGTTEVTYTATDACGNTSTCWFFITVTDNCCTSSPIITCPDDFWGCPGTDIASSNTGTATAVAGDPNCDPPVITYQDIEVINGDCPGTISFIRVWTAADLNHPNLTASCEQGIELSDNEAPVSVYCPADITGWIGEPVNWQEPTFEDNCLFNVTSNYYSGDVFPVGTTTIVYTATDPCGNTTTCTFHVTIEPNVIIDCPDDITVNCEASGSTIVEWDEPSFTSGCNDCASGEPISGFIFMGAFDGHLYYCSLDPQSWVQAQYLSHSNGGHLAVVNSAAENAFLANLLVNQNAFIGLSDASSEGSFQWVNGDAVTYTNWYPGQPNDYAGQQDFVEMLSTGQWNDQYNTKLLEFIMEIPCSSVIQTSGPTSGSVFPEGTTTVTYEVTDACGNVGTCSFKVTVDDAINFDCPDGVTVYCSGSGAYITWSDPEATTCCSESCAHGEPIPGFMYMGELSGSYYYCSLQPALWPTAQAISASHGGYLASINSATENNFLANILTLQSAYIGLNDAGQEGSFVWANGDPLTYSNWYPNQPNDYLGQQDYVEMLNNGLWNDQYNTQALEYIMEIPGCVNVFQTGGPASGSFFPKGSTTTISYEATDACGNGAWCSFDITVESSGCSPGGVSTKNAYINHVGFHTINNYSGNNGGYADYTNLCTKITPGQVCGISLSPGFGPNGPTTVYWKVWVDWNMDGDFFDSGEYFAYGSSAGTINGNLGIPTNIWNGYTTMRVSMKKGGWPSGPCEKFWDGETEDYCLYIVGGSDLKGSEEDINLSSRSKSDAQVISGSAKNKVGKMKLFPNPATDRVNVQFDVTVNGEMVILNSSGQVVKEVKSVTQDQSIDLDGLTSGLYIMMYYDGEGNKISKEFVVN